MNSFPPKPLNKKNLEFCADKQHRFRWHFRDLLLVFLLTLGSAFFIFFNLGNRFSPQTFWESRQAGDGFVVDFGKITPIQRINLFEGPPGQGKTRIEYSLNGVDWALYIELTHKVPHVFTWQPIDPIYGIKPLARYVRFTTIAPGYRLYEAAFFTKPKDKEPELLPIKTVTPQLSNHQDRGTVQHIFDEQNLAPYRPDYRNGMYFDEIYHGRTAYEFAHSLEPYETTHPPLGKNLLMIGIKWFGMTPFGWRFMAGVFGTCMIPLFYAVAKGMFGRTRYAFIATLLLLFEGFHLVHARFANIDIFGVTFTILMFYAMYRYGETLWQAAGFKRSLLWLAVSGIFFGAAAAVKWNYLYGGAGLAVLFFGDLCRRFYESKRMKEGDDKSFTHQKLLLTFFAAFIFFIAVPIMIYVLSYKPYLLATKAQDGIQDLWNYQKNMYNYHTEVKQSHPYASKWYTWALMLRPVWLYGGRDLPAGLAQSIVAIGNPLIWWGGLFALFVACFFTRCRRDHLVLALLVMYLSFYVPWIFAPRKVTFMYHYFPMVPLLILSIVWILRYVEEKSGYGKWVTRGVCLIAGLLFILFFPVYTGRFISREWINEMVRWLPTWGF